MLQNTEIFDPKLPVYSIKTGNFTISFLQPGWISPGPEDPSRFELYPHLLEINLCLRGKGRIELNGTDYAVESGSVWFSTRQNNVFWQEINRQEMTLLRVPFWIEPYRSDACTTLQDRILCDFDQAYHDRPAGFSPIGYDPSLCEYSDFLKRRISVGSLCGFECILTGFLMDVLHVIEEAKEPSTEIQRIETYVKANAMQKISVRDLAKLLSVSDRSLFYLFAKHLQVSPNDYINRIRMNSAAEHLAGGLTVREVSELFKFSETTSFCRMFKKYYGCTPTEFKKQNPAAGKTAENM